MKMQPLQKSYAPALMLLFAAANCLAATPWSEAPKQAYIARCSSSMSEQGMPTKTAQSFCSCIANGMSAEFGLEEQSQVMAAEPNPKGSAYDRRLYKVFAVCGSTVPK